ncbi:hypothetical protein QYE76_065598 [Lolium multiflorum]|uniref:GAG-pre-integrase domain-containing protein n=1 Tax=Lolium multiflorum TaxID=4521 RepID=A0AAD8W916_LOLMU|nr:hypothetical protein QYE76_065598 [Lolium multiflorum]
MVKLRHRRRRDGVAGTAEVGVDGELGLRRSTATGQGDVVEDGECTDARGAARVPWRSSTAMAFQGAKGQGEMRVAQPLCLATRREDEAWQWHERFGHLHFEALKRLSTTEMVRGMPCLDHVEQFCDVCVLTKQRRLPFPQQASFRAKEKLELVHGDLCGPVTPATPGGDALAQKN